MRCYGSWANRIEREIEAVIGFCDNAVWWRVDRGVNCPLIGSCLEADGPAIDLRVVAGLAGGVDGALDIGLHALGGGFCAAYGVDGKSRRVGAYGGPNGRCNEGGEFGVGHGWGSIAL